MGTRLKIVFTFAVFSLGVFAYFNFTKRQESPDPAQSADTLAKKVSSTDPMLVTQNPALNSFCNSSLPCELRIPDDFGFRLVNLQNKLEVSLVLGVLKNREEPEVVRNAATNLLHNSDSEDFELVLIGILLDPQESICMRTFAVQHLDSFMQSRERSRTQIEKTMESVLLTESNPTEIRGQAFQTLLRRNHPVAHELQQRVLSTQSADKVLQVLAIEALQDRKQDELLPFVRKFLKSENHRIRLATIATLGVMQDIESRAEIATLRDSADAQLRMATMVALKNIDAPVTARMSDTPKPIQEKKLNSNF